MLASADRLSHLRRAKDLYRSQALLGNAHGLFNCGRLLLAHGPDELARSLAKVYLARSARRNHPLAMALLIDRFSLSRSDEKVFDPVTKYAAWRLRRYFPPLVRPAPVTLPAPASELSSWFDRSPQWRSEQRFLEVLRIEDGLTDLPPTAALPLYRESLAESNHSGAAVALASGAVADPAQRTAILNPALPAWHFDIDLLRKGVDPDVLVMLFARPRRSDFMREAAAIGQPDGPLDDPVRNLALAADCGHEEAVSACLRAALVGESVSSLSLSVL